MQQELFPTSDNLGEFRVSRVREVTASIDPVDCPERIESLWKDRVTSAPWYDPDKEQLVTFTLNTKHHPTGVNLVSIGSLNECIAHPREILRPVIVANAYAFIIAHNHPSGDVSPSNADRAFTKRLAELGGLLGIELLDSLIFPSSPASPKISNASYFSFREMGAL